MEYSKKQAQKFLQGKSPPDFAPEDYEVNYKNRATINELTPLGKKQLSNCKIYSGEKHSHEAQQPKKVDFIKLNEKNFKR